MKFKIFEIDKNGHLRETWCGQENYDSADEAWKALQDDEDFLTGEFTVMLVIKKKAWKAN